MDIYVILFSKLPILTWVFLAVIAILWIYFFFIKFNISTVSNAPSILTSIGIFGTFLGIAIGLQGFDTSNIQAGVPQLIGGLKTAFWSSIAGILAATTIKIRHLLIMQSTPQGESSHGGNIDDLIDKIDGVNKALVGEDESTLLSQMKLARQDSNDRLDSLRKSMDKYLETMAENNSNALIDALSEVMKDFNAKINEQFGDNFKQLNEAVGAILVWQERYRTQIDEMIMQQQKSAGLMGIAVDRYKDIIAKSEIFVDVSQSLSTVLDGLETQRLHLHGSLENLAELLNTAKTGLPELEQKIGQMVGEVTHGVRTSSEAMIELLSDTSRKFNDVNERIEKSVETLDKALSEQLTKSLESLGSQLASLSQKFVDDYTPLTEKLREVVRLSERR